jgi:hypothetical protein
MLRTFFVKKFSVSCTNVNVSFQGNQGPGKTRKKHKKRDLPKGKPRFVAFVNTVSLRRHYPDQVQGSKDFLDLSSFLSAGRSPSGTLN